MSADTATKPVQAENLLSSKSDDAQACQWSGCTEKCATPELLYDHICERHVGRKSTNNLCLTCAWGTCRTTTVKRDHITSHIRVHVPLKPHKCDFCGKSFKRPQDLKKHVKTHADDSVLRTPDPARADRATAGGFYDTALPHSAAAYAAPLGATSLAGNFFGAQQAQQHASYGNVYYGAGGESEMTQAAMRQRGIDALNEFLLDVKRRQFDPASYAEVGNRLLQLQSLANPLSGVTDYQQSAPLLTGNAGAHSGPASQYQYSLPRHPDLRTKNDLLNIDHFLAQMATTVYENPTQAAAAGYPQQGYSTAHAANGFRSSNSPPQLHPTTATSSAPMMASTPSSTDTPALTPPSSSMSSASGYSPISLPSVHGTSPDPQTMGGMYPSLPALSSAADSHHGYTASAAPPSGLGSAFEMDSRRRFSGGRLQQSEGRQAPPTSFPEDAMETGQETPRAKSPSAANAASPASESSGSEDEFHNWVDNMRVIEALRAIVKDALDTHKYDDAEDMDVDEKEKEVAHEDDAEVVYPSIRPA